MSNHQHDHAEKHKKQEEEVKKWEQRAAEDEDLMGLEHPSYEELQAKLTTMEKQSQEHKEAWLRAEARLKNEEKRAQIDIENALKYGTEKLINTILPVFDSLEQSLALMENAKANFKEVHSGLEMTFNMFQKALEQLGVVQLNPMGEAFNPTYHQAMAMEESSEAKSGTVIVVLQKGYTLNDRLIRPALVKVAK